MTPNSSLIPGPITDRQLDELRDAHVSGILPQNAGVQAAAASKIIKPFGGKLYGVSVLNTNANGQFILLFDANAVPANGSVPVARFACAGFVAATGGGNLGIYYGSTGRAFEQGIVICNSSTSATLTIGAADCFFDAQFI